MFSKCSRTEINPSTRLHFCVALAKNGHSSLVMKETTPLVTSGRCDLLWSFDFLLELGWCFFTVILSQVTIVAIPIRSTKRDHTTVDLESNLVMFLAFQTVCSQPPVYLSLLKPLNNGPGVKNIGCNLHVPCSLQISGIAEQWKGFLKHQLQKLTLGSWISECSRPTWST